MAQNPFSLEGKVAFVTGSARGLGEAMAKAFLDAGAKGVVISDVRPELPDTAKRLDPTGTRVLAQKLDVKDLKAFQAAFDAGVARFGGIDIMVNNAGRTVQCPPWDVTPEDWDDVMAINLRSVFFGCKIAATHMKGRGWGRIINLTSIAGQAPSAVAGAHYATSKAGIMQITRTWALELVAHGITVNNIAPAAIDGPIMEIVTPERRAILEKNSPMGRFGRMDEIGAAALYLASESSAYMTGATLDINGGRLMRL